MIVRDEIERRSFFFEDGVFKNPQGEKMEVVKVAFLPTNNDYYDMILLYLDNQKEPCVFRVTEKIFNSFKQKFKR